MAISMSSILKAITAEQEAARVAAEQEAIRQEQAILAELARQEAARQEAIRQEQARQAAAAAAAKAAAKAAAAAKVNSQKPAATTTPQKPAATTTPTSFASYISPTSQGDAWNALGVTNLINQLEQRFKSVTGVNNIADLEQRTINIPTRVTVTNENGVYYKHPEDGNAVPLTQEEINKVVATPVDTPVDTDSSSSMLSKLRRAITPQRSYTYYLDTFNQEKQIYNKQTGQPLSVQPKKGPLAKNPSYYLGGWGEGEGMTHAYLSFNESGKPVVKTVAESTSDAEIINVALSIALMAVPGLGQAIGSALLPAGVSTAAATAVGNAVVNAGLQVASGVPVEKAIVNSAASLGVSQLVPNLSGNVFVDNAVKSVATAALTGGDVGNALANSLIATGGNELLGNASFTGDKVVDSAIASAITSGVQAAATGGDVGESVISGGISGASGQLTKEEKATESAKSGAGFIGEGVTEPTNVAGDIGKDTVTIPPSGNTVVVIEVDKNSNEALVIDEVGNTSVVSATDSATGDSVNSGEVVTLTPDNSLTTGQATVAGGIADDMASGGLVDTAPVITAPVDTGVTDTGAIDTTQVATGGEASSTNIDQGITEPTNVAEPSIDPRILAQGVAGGQFGEGELLQAGAQVPVNALQDLMRLRPELVSMNDSGNYSLKVPTADGGYTAYEISPSGQVLNAQSGLSVQETYPPSKLASAIEDTIKIEEGRSSEQAVPEGSRSSGSVQPKATDLSPAAQETLLQIGGVLGLGEQDPDAVYEALIGGASGGIGDVALLGYDQLTKLQDEIELIFDEPNLPADAKSEIARIYAEVTDQKRIQEEAIRDQLLNEQKPTEQQVADTGLTVVGQPVYQTLVVSPTTPYVTTPTISPVVTEPVVTQPSVTQPVVTEPVVTQPVVPEPVVTQPVTQQPTTPDIVTTAPSTTPPVTQPVEQTPTVEPLPPPPIVEPTPPTSEVTGIVLQNNGDGTALVLTNDGNATNVPVTDAVSNEPLTPGASVTVDQNTNTATITPPVSGEGAQEPVAPVSPTVEDTGNQQVIGGGQEPTTDAGTVINTPIGPDTYTPPTAEPVVSEPPPPPPLPPEVPTTPQEPITQPPQEPTEEDLLLEQIIQELEPKPPVSEGVPIQEPVFPEPPLVLPESPTINVDDSLTVRPRVERRATRPSARPSVSPGSRVEESAQILPLRPGLSEGGTGGIEGTTEQEQEPVWNVRSLKLRRLLGI